MRAGVRAGVREGHGRRAESTHRLPRRAGIALLSPGPWFSLLAEKHRVRQLRPAHPWVGHRDLPGLCRHPALEEKPEASTALCSLHAAFSTHGHCPPGFCHPHRPRPSLAPELASAQPGLGPHSPCTGMCTLYPGKLGFSEAAPTTRLSTKASSFLLPESPSPTSSEQHTLAPFLRQYPYSSLLSP